MKDVSDAGSLRSLSIELLGPVLVSRDGVPQALPRSRKTRALLAYLALQQRPIQREELCDLLWQGAPDPRSELRWSLAKIRPILGPCLDTSSTHVALRGPALQVDSLLFIQLAAQAASESEVEHALKMWRGHPLADVDVHGQQAFQAWLALARDNFAGARTAMLKTAVDREWQSPATALRAARRLVSLEPWNDWGHARVAQLLERSGRDKEAAAYIVSTRRSLSQDLGLPEQALLIAPPEPAAHSQARRSVQIEPLRRVHRGQEIAALGSRVEALLAEAMLRRDCLALQENSRRRNSWPDACDDAEFGVRGTVAQLGSGYFVSLRCINLRRQLVVWAGQAQHSSAGCPGLAGWVGQAIDAISIAIQRSSLELTDADLDRERLRRAGVLASALELRANQAALQLLKDISGGGKTGARGFALAAWCHAQRAVYNWSAAPEQDRSEARMLASAATCAPESMGDPHCLTTIATARMLVGESDAAEALLERALHLDRSAAYTRLRSGWLANYAPDPERAVRHFQAAMHKAPLDPAYFNALAGMGAACFIQQDYPRAIRYMEQSLALKPNASWILRNLIPAYAAVREYGKAERALCTLLASYPRLSVRDVTEAMVFPAEVLGRIAAGLRAAGLPP